MILLYAVGVVVLFLLLLLSIALHELGHLSFAKLFGVRVSQYMVGFGPTIWSKRKGDTEYGLKWIPLGGYIRMIGMLPPRPQDPEGKLRSAATSPFRGLIESARGAALEEVGPGDEDRVFYVKKWWQKIVIMFAGPAMNLILAFLFIGAAVMAIGDLKAQPVVGTVSACTIPGNEQRDCRPTDKPTPAAAAGLKAGDRIISFDGRKIEKTDGDRVRSIVRDEGGRTVPMVVDRGGRQVTLNVTLVENQMPRDDDPAKTDKVGFLGVGFAVEHTPGGPGTVLSTMGDMTTHTVGALVDMPKKMVGVWHAAFGNEKRDPNGPIGVVGASRLGGQVAAEHAPLKDKAFFFLMLIGSLNFAVGMFNLVPLLPLDGGHIAGGLWEGLKRLFAKVLRRPTPGHVDVAKLLPLTYVMASVFLVMGALLIYADLVNPVKLGG